MQKTAYIFFLCFFIKANDPAKAQDGSLDLSFGTGGLVRTSIGTGALGTCMAIQSDGKIIVGGRIYDPFQGVGLTRYNTDGSLDTSFDSDGIAETFVGSSQNCYDVLIQSDGKIILIGSIRLSNPNNDFLLIRYNSDGSLDSTFDSDGIVTTDFAAADDYANAGALQSDGKIVVAGYVGSGASQDFGLARYNINGSLDTGFDLDGKLNFSFFGDIDQCYSVNIQSDDKIVASGVTLNGGDYDFATARFNADGSFDNSFDSDGKVSTDIGGTGDFAYSNLIQPDGKIVVGGTSSSPDYNFSLVRYNSNGTLDNSFDLDGIVLIAGPDGEEGKSLGIQSDGKIVLGGVSITGFDRNFAVARFNINGSIDPSFDLDGLVTTQFGSQNDEGADIKIQSDGQILLAGKSQDFSAAGEYVFSIVRYNASPVGIKEVNSSSTLKLFPNPTNEKINLESSRSLNNAGIRIVDISGQTILSQQNVSGNYFTFDISSYSNGLYFLEVGDDGGFERIKFVKE